MGAVKNPVSIHEAMKRVAEYPVMLDDDLIQVPAHELICRTLFEISNRPDATQRGSMARANKARKMILERLVGKRRAGSHPATRVEVSIDFVDLTGGAIEQGAADEPEEEPVDA